MQRLWSRICAKALAPEVGLKIVGITDGETIRTAGGTPPVLRLEARGGQQELIWLINGRQIGRTLPGRAITHTFSEAGRFALTVMDEAGRYDRVEISVH